MDARIRYSSYSRGDIFDRTIDPDELQCYCPMDQVSSKTPSASQMRNATASLGRFDKLPVETAQNILSNLDLDTLTSLRSTSKRLNLLVDSLFPYKEVFTHAPNALRALLSTGATRYFTATDLQSALRSQNCFLCRSRFGAFLYLLECRRCCWHCLVTSQHLMPISKDAAQLLYHLDAKTTLDLPTIQSIPGAYGPKQARRPEFRSKGGIRVEFVAYGAAREAAAKVQALSEDYEKAKVETRIALRGPLAQDHMRDMDCMNYDPMGYKGGYGLEPQRFMAAVRFPSLVTVAGNGAATAAVEWGVSCLGCLEKSEKGQEERLWNEQFSVEGLAEHLEECGKAEELWVGDRVGELNKRGKGVGVPAK